MQAKWCITCFLPYQFLKIQNILYDPQTEYPIAFACDDDNLLLMLIFILLKINNSSQMQVAQNSLAEVRLTEAAKMRAGSYSGGMKRRLSVAIALIGDPKLVILDEPVRR